MAVLLLVTLVPVAFLLIFGAKALAPRLRGRRVPGRIVLRLPQSLAGLLIAPLLILSVLAGAVAAALAGAGLGLREDGAAWDLLMGAGVGLGLGALLGALVIVDDRYADDPGLRPLKASLRAKPGQEPRRLDLAVLLPIGLVSVLMMLGAMSSSPRLAGVFLAPFLASVLTVLVFANWSDERLALARKVPDWLLALDGCVLGGAFAYALATRPTFFLHMGWQPFAIAAILVAGAAYHHWRATRR